MSHKVQDLVIRSGCSWASQATKDIGNTTPFTDEHVPNKGPFSGLTICVTGLSREARRQVQITTEKLGGKYSADLHLGCTHLVVQSSGGRKFEYALKHSAKKGLYVVTLPWFVNSARLHERLDESQYDGTKACHELPNASSGAQKIFGGRDHTCIPHMPLSSISEHKNLPTSKPEESRPKKVLASMCFYLDGDVSRDMQTRVVEACVRDGATCISDWYIGCNATHIICEENAIVKYIGYKTHLVSPLWVLKSVKERTMQHLVHISLDLVRCFPALFDQRLSKPELRNGKKLLALCGQEEIKTHQLQLEKAEEKVRAAKACIRRRRGPNSQPCRALPRPITPSSMLESICWSISEPASTAQFYLDNSCSPGLYDQASEYFDAHDSGKENEISVRPLTESEKRDVVYKGTFLTILFPVDRYSEMGPSSRSFFDEKGFTRQQIIENVYTFYQEYLSPFEIEVAINTDSKHSERLRAVYAAPETLAVGYVPTKRYEFLGSRRNFEGLRRLSIENSGQVYQLCLGS